VNLRGEFFEARLARRALAVAQAATLSACFYLSYRVLPVYRPYLRHEQARVGPFREFAWMLLVILPLWYALYERAGLLAARRIALGAAFKETLRATLLGLAALALLIFAFKATSTSRLLIFGFSLAAVPTTLAVRQSLLGWFRARRSHIYNVVRIAVIGTRERAREFMRAAQSTESCDYQLVGCFDPEPEAAPAEVEGAPLLGSTEGIGSYLFDHPVDMVVLAMPAERVPNCRAHIEAALELGLRVAVLPDFYLPRLGYAHGWRDLRLEPVAGCPAVALSDLDRPEGYRAAKRILDVAVSSALLVLLSPLLIAIAALVRFTSPDGPIFYRWRVLGINKKPFTGYKFRTMVRNAEALKPDFLALNEMDGPVFKLRHDPRVTPLGRILRKYSLDELPQLWSVLKGDMSLVGPRPSFAEEAQRYEFWQRRKLSIKPGITCLWQVNGRNEIRSFEQWARLDLEYIASASLWLDCKILLKTIPVVLRGRGAY
jgi:exopolysaccharide biosynthesis polyprenyl glycosylphosphotransferase